MLLNKKDNAEIQKNVQQDDNILSDTDASYLSGENHRIKQAILRTDTDKFFLFTRMLRISSMLKNAKVAHKQL